MFWDKIGAGTGNISGRKRSNGPRTRGPETKCPGAICTRTRLIPGQNKLRYNWSQDRGIRTEIVLRQHLVSKITPHLEHLNSSCANSHSCKRRQPTLYTGYTLRSIIGRISSINKSLSIQYNTTLRQWQSSDQPSPAQRQAATLTQSLWVTVVKLALEFFLELFESFFHIVCSSTFFHEHGTHNSMCAAIVVAPLLDR